MLHILVCSFNFLTRLWQLLISWVSKGDVFEKFFAVLCRQFQGVTEQKSIVCRFQTNERSSRLAFSFAPLFIHTSEILLCFLHRLLLLAYLWPEWWYSRETVSCVKYPSVQITRRPFLWEWSRFFSKTPHHFCFI